MIPHYPLTTCSRRPPKIVHCPSRIDNTHNLLERRRCPRHKHERPATVQSSSRTPTMLRDAAIDRSVGEERTGHTAHGMRLKVVDIPPVALVHRKLRPLLQAVKQPVRRCSRKMNGLHFPQPLDRWSYPGESASNASLPAIQQLSTPLLQKR